MAYFGPVDGDNNENMKWYFLEKGGILKEIFSVNYCFQILYKTIVNQT